MEQAIVNTKTINLGNSNSWFAIFYDMARRGVRENRWS